LVVGGSVDRQPDELRVALLELGVELGHVAELGGAHRREVLGMREQHAPAVAQPLVEVDLPLGGVRGEVRGLVSQAKCHVGVLSVSPRCRGRGYRLPKTKSTGQVGFVGDRYRPRVTRARGASTAQLAGTVRGAGGACSSGATIV